MPFVHPLVATVQHFFHRHGLHPAGVVAVSGGPDSVALLRALASCRAGSPLVVAHLNHRLRGAESDADEGFVRDLAASLGLEFAVEQTDAAAQANEAGENLEATARRLRYEWLASVAARWRFGWVATGHTANDQAETVLHRLLRGSGLKGLRGIAARRPLASGVEVVRPLLQVTREEVLAYLAAEGQSYREDRSNADLRLTRNRIRHELLPHLAERYNPAVVRVLTRLAEQAEEVYAGAEEEARRLLVEAERPRAGSLMVLDRRTLAAAPRHRLREALRLLWQREGWPVDAMGFEHWQRLADVARGDAAAVDLPGGISARRREQVVQIGLRT